MAVADSPAAARRPGRFGRMIVEGAWRGLYIRVILEADDDVVTAFPLGGGPR